MNQLFLMPGFYLIGFLFGLLFVRRIPYLVITNTAFLWGALFWVLYSLLLLVTGIRYTLLSTLLFFVSTLGVLIYLNIRRQSWKVESVRLLYPAIMLLSIITIGLITSQVNLAWAETDAVYPPVTAHWLVLDGPTEWNVTEFTSRGVFLTMMEISSATIGDGYLFSIMPIFVLAFVLTLLYFFYRELHGIIKQGVWAWLPPALLIVLYLSTPLIIEHTFYLHNNFRAGIYLFTAAAMAWLAIREANNTYYVFSTLAFLGAGLLRLEAPLVVVIFLAVLISTGKQTYRERVLLAAAPVLLLALWYATIMLLVDDNQWDIILGSPERTAVYIAILVAFAGFVLLTKIPFFEQILMKNLHIILVGVLVILLSTSLILATDKMVESIHSTWLNINGAGHWGGTWAIFLAMIPVLFARTNLPNERLFPFWIIAFVLFIETLAYARLPYHTHHGDTSNRMMLHITPIMLMYYLLKYKYWIGFDSTKSTSRPAVLAEVKDT